MANLCENSSFGELHCKPICLKGTVRKWSSDQPSIPRKKAQKKRVTFKQKWGFCSCVHRLLEHALSTVWHFPTLHAILPSEGAISAVRVPTHQESVS